jgi:spore coat protein CotH
LTINLDSHVKDQEFRGYDKFYLNNSVQDRSYCNEIICRELFQRAGIPTPRATHATVELNGRDLGLYVMIEGFNKKWLKRHFDTIGGNLYDSGFLKDITCRLKGECGRKSRGSFCKK